MQLGILADIHGNSRALEAVLEDAHHRGIRQFVDLGDVLYGPLEPRQTYDIIQSVNLIAQVSGNQDRLIREAQKGANPTLDFVLDDLGPGPIAWLSKLPQTVVLENEILLCHGTPASDTTYLLENVSNGKPYVRSEEEIANHLGHAINVPLVLCGHTHIPRLIQLKNGPLVLNPGSIGLPAYDDDAPIPHVMETFSPHACYAVIEKFAKGWTASFHRVPYDWQAAAARAHELGRPDWAQGLEFGRMK